MMSVCKLLAGDVWRVYIVNVCGVWRGGGLGSSTISKNLMSPTPRRKWYLTTGVGLIKWYSTPSPNLSPYIFLGLDPSPPPLVVRAIFLCRFEQLHESHVMTCRNGECCMICTRVVIVRMSDDVLSCAQIQTAR